MRVQILRITTHSLMTAALMLPMAALAQNEIHHGPDIPPDGRGSLVRQMPPRGQSGTGGSVSQGNGISYHNGPVMWNGVNIYYIWYGNWAQDPTANAILTDYATYVGGSPYFNINTTYGDTVGNVLNTPGTIRYAGSTSDSGSLGTSLTDGNIWTLVTNALSGGKLPVDPNGVYFVLTAPYVTESSFLSQYCGWHTAGSYNNTSIKYAFVGNAAGSLGSCAEQSTGPNGDPEADAMVSVIAHELEESATDPLLNAWYDSSGQENADKCVWTFGSTYTVPNGSQANMTIGPRDYLIQRNWVNAGGGYCALSYSAPTTPDFSLSETPGTQTVLAGQATGNYTVTATPVNGWSGTVNYTLTGLPAGAFANISGNVISIATTAGVTPGGSYTFTISGTDGTLTHTTSATLGVTVPEAPTFNISISPNSQSVKRPSSGSQSATFAVTITATTGYSGSVTLTAGGATTGVSLNLSSASVTNGSGTSTLTATVTSSSKKGNNSLSVTARDGTTTKSVSASVRVN
jgi:hypothetical protein